MRNRRKYSIVDIITCKGVCVIGTNFQLRKKRVAELLITLVFCSWLVACGSSPKPATGTAPTANVPVLPVAFSSLDERLNQAERLFHTGQFLASVEMYLNLAEELLVAGSCNKVHAILAGLEAYVKPNSTSWQQARYLRSACQHPNDDIATRIDLLGFVPKTETLAQKRAKLLTELYIESLNYREALIAYLQTSDASAETAWALTQQMPLSELSLTGVVNVDAYLSLAKIIRQYALVPSELAIALTQWQFSHPNHEILNENIIPFELLLSASEFPSDTEIAILLPLEGRLGNSGKQIKDGILSAYFASKHSFQLRFINTHEVNVEAIVQQIQGVDIVIGPLLKTEIDALRPLLRPQQILLALNRIPVTLEQTNTENGDNLIASQQFFFGLAPEDEAQQLAEYVYTNQYQQPIMIHAQDATATRMAEAFALRWQTINPKAPLKTLTFTNNADMRKQITEALGVATSQQRARRLEQFHGSEIFSVTRNRRDVDAFIVFANAKQTELINPMIEASLSTFSDKITPVYASSRSYNHDLNQNSLRDLQNVFFIEMPWVLDTTAQELKATYNILNPTASTSEQRLFAMGYDAYQLLFNLNKLSKVPNLQFIGLTGELRLENNTLYRRLPQAQISQNSIRVVGQVTPQ